MMKTRAQHTLEFHGVYFRSKSTIAKIKIKETRIQLVIMYVYDILLLLQRNRADWECLGLGAKKNTWA
jgi:hypothetical protein